MKYIADTHVLLWMMFEPRKLSQKVKNEYFMFRLGNRCDIYLLSRYRALG